MVTIGADPHERTHTVVAVDDDGRRLAERTVGATPAGHLELLAWAKERFPERRWALEDCRHLSRRLERDLITAGETVVRVPPKPMAGARRSGRESGKSDPIDALAVARAALRETDLPVARLEGPEREVRLLLDHRDDLVAERTRAQNRLRWHLHELTPGEEPVARSLDRRVVLDRLAADLEDRTGAVARIAAELVARIRELTGVIDRLEREIAASVASLARHNGSAPVPARSANSGRHRLSRTGNRQLNVALHRIAITRMRLEGRGRDHIAKRRAADDTKTEAIRALRRRISDEVYRRMRHDDHLRATGQAPLAMAA